MVSLSCLRGSSDVEQGPRGYILSLGGAGFCKCGGQI